MIISFLYKQLIARITTTVPDIKHIDLYNGQLTHEAEEHPWNCPAVFVEFNEIQWEQRGNRKQEGDCEVRLYCMFDNVALERASIHPDAVIDQGLAHLDIVNQLFVALQNFQAQDDVHNIWFTKLTRTRSSFDNNANTYITHMMSFTTRLYDTAAVPSVNTITVDPFPQGDIVSSI